MNNEIDFRHAVNDMACSRITFDSDYIVVKADQRKESSAASDVYKRQVCV